MTDSQAGNIQADRCYRYEIEQGAVYLGAGSDPQRENGIIISGGALIALRQGELVDTRHLQEAKRMMRRILAHYLDDKPLQTAQASFHQVL